MARMLHRQALDMAGYGAQLQSGTLGARHGVNGIRRLDSASTWASAESVFERRTVWAKRCTSLGFSTATSMPLACSSEYLPVASSDTRADPSCPATRSVPGGPGRCWRRRAARTSCRAVARHDKRGAAADLRDRLGPLRPQGPSAYPPQRNHRYASNRKRQRTASRARGFDLAAYSNLPGSARLLVFVKDCRF